MWQAGLPESEQEVAYCLHNLVRLSRAQDNSARAEGYLQRAQALERAAEGEVWGTMVLGAHEQQREGEMWEAIGKGAHEERDTVKINSRMGSV